MTKFIISTLITFTAIISTSIAQNFLNNNQVDNQSNIENNNSYNKSENTEYTNKIGISASMFSGYGLSIQQHLTNKFRIELNGLIYGTAGNIGEYVVSNALINRPVKDNTLDYVIGFEIHTIFYSSKNTKLYFFLGTSYWYHDNQAYFDYLDYSDVRQTYIYTIKEKLTVYGVGFGTQYEISKYIIIDFEVGYSFNTNKKYYLQSNEQYVSEYGIDGYNRFNQSIGIGGGIYFAF